MTRISLAIKALRELGPRQLGLYALYRLGLRTGYIRWRTSGDKVDRRSGIVGRPTEDQKVDLFKVAPAIMSLPSRGALVAALGELGRAQLLAEADEVVDGRVRLFGGAPVPLQLSTQQPLAHWTEYERASKKEGGQGEGVGDVKLLWEPARFGWAYTLGRAYRFNGDERYAEAFWEYAEKFLEANPPNQGPHWVSAQEVALRLIAFVFALYVFETSSQCTPERRERLVKAIAEHAARIPPTLIYARSQNNNHLLTEAAGLYAAGVTLQNHPKAGRWRSLGWLWFNRGVQSQVASDGAYMQNSANYHRLMLQITLWMRLMAESQGQQFPESTSERLASATRWLLALLDHGSGCVPNLGPNDGAYILPLTVCAFGDYRPALQSAGLAFLGVRPLEAGLWDEMGFWLGLTDGERKVLGIEGDEGRVHDTLSSPPSGSTPHVLSSPDHPSWAYLRVASFRDRPGHADQLHLDLWWRGLNLAQDPGTYRYNAPPPWDNALMGAAVHNTLTVNGRDQMTRAGRFLYLDWAQAQLLEGERGERGAWKYLEAQHNGFRGLGVIHRRSVAARSDGRWRVEDALLAENPRLVSRYSPFTVGLHWLAPDWPWEMEGEIEDQRFRLRLKSPHGWITLATRVRSGLTPSSTHQPASFQIVRAGERVYGSGSVLPVWGWSSPTYGDKIPALSIRLTAQDHLPLFLVSEWTLPLEAE